MAWRRTLAGMLAVSALTATAANAASLEVRAADVFATTFAFSSPYLATDTFDFGVGTRLGEEPGSPWGIGATEGGHKSIHPELGTLEDFRRLVTKARELKIEIALDIGLGQRQTGRAAIDDTAERRAMALAKARHGKQPAKAIPSHLSPDPPSTKKRLRHRARIRARSTERPETR